MMAWEVQQHTLCQGWVNTWSEEVDGVSRPLLYATEDEAAFDLKAFLTEISDEIAYGERDPDNGFDPEEFRIVEVPAVP